MANSKSAEKRWRQSIVRRSRNRSRLSRLRTSLKRVRAAVAEGDATKAQELLPSTLGLIDRTSAKGSIHPNAAARYKSRLVRLVRGASASEDA